MSQAKKKYITRDELHKENYNDERAICEEYFADIFKINRKLDEKGQLTVDFQLISNATDHLPELYQDQVFSEIINNLIKAEDKRTQKFPELDRGLNSKDFSQVVMDNFLGCDEELRSMFDELKNRRTGLIGFDEVHSLMHGIGDECLHTKHSKHDLQKMITSACKDDNGMTYEEFYDLMTSKQF